MIPSPTSVVKRTTEASCNTKLTWISMTAFPLMGPGKTTMAPLITKQKRTTMALFLNSEFSPLLLPQLRNPDQRDVLGQRWLSDDAIDLAQ